MARTTSKSWERYGRRFLLRLSFKRPAELAVMDEFDRRSAELGKPDKEYLKLCLSVGNQILSAKALGSVSVALSNNESNNTQKDEVRFSSNESRVETTVVEQQQAQEPEPPSVPRNAAQQEREATPPPAAEQGRAPSAKGLLGGLMRHG
ncbi:TPA: hypothetical protein L4623_005346 [Pseudomonas aeruginosa]|jgi:hypothetical protein|uniref:Uncharacterized protein n=4 Tax=root TaxID=1 RepID=A0A6H1Q8A4_PSEAI|nr:MULTISPECIES: hypothetical protein [Pseudomonadaceae]MCY4124582.1 hypothetical protein [Pseudomonas sp.]QPN48139.1 hypothetical protein I5S86_28485 [Priestia aryabhattai]AFK73066.1 hypothetical protein YSA_p00203 [Pseudomonas putida ND6]EGB97764.1 hypothetical protein G1E_16863 [Pseudomonas sp. TJI-51]EKB4879489.1 hypothetical protein [Pseudomonas aeruginosa]